MCMCEVTQQCLFSLGGGGEVVCVWIRVWLMTSQLHTQNMRSDYPHTARCETGYTNTLGIMQGVAVVIHIPTSKHSLMNVECI